jgi:hypothetical protein
MEIIDVEEIQKELEDEKEFWMRFGQLGAIEEIFGLENQKPQLHLTISRYFLPEKEIRRKYTMYPKAYTKYKDYLEADCWEIREIR